MDSFEQTNNELLHLRTERLLSNIRVCLQDPEQLILELWVLICKLEGECWEDHLEIASISEVS